MKNLVIALAAALPVLANAQTYPTKPIRYILGYEAGGVTDQLARVTGQQIGEQMGQPVVVENRPGASSIIAMMACSRAPADGYTICLAVADSFSYNPQLFTNLPYDPETDFAPIVNLATSSSILIASMNGPTSVKDMVARAKAKPGSINWGTWGPSTLPDVYLRWISTQTGTDMVGVPYKGATPIIAAMLAGDVQVTYVTIGAALQHIKAGKIKAIAFIGKQRSPILPDVPTIVEEGVDPGLGAMFGVFAPAKTPRPVIDRLNAEFNKALHTPRAQDFMRTWTMSPVGGTTEQFAAYLKQDRANAARVFKAIGVKPSPAPQ